MADTLTTNYGWIMPEDQASADTWGQKLNGNFQAIDGVVWQQAQTYQAQIGPGSINWSNPTAPAGQQVRWAMSLINAETGTPLNSGSDLALSRYDDTGGQSGVMTTPVMTFTRTGVGAVTFTVPATFTGQMTCSAICNFTGEIVMGPNAPIAFGSTTGPGGARLGQLVTTNVFGNPVLQLQGGGGIQGAVAAGSNGVYVQGGALRIYAYNGYNAGISFYDFNNVLTASLNYTAQGQGQTGAFAISSTGGTIALGQSGGAPAGAFSYSGQAGAFKPGGGSWSSLSDARIKTVEGDYADGLEQVLGLNPVVYRYKDGEGFSDDLRVGLIAQDVEQVMPNMVSRSEGTIAGEPVNDLRTLDTSELIFALVNSIKELHARIEVLEAKTASP